MLLLPVRANDVVARLFGSFGQRRQKLRRRLAVIKRHDQRLDDGDGAVVSARIAPHFQLMRLRDMPLAILGGLVVVKAEAHAQPGFL